MPAEYHGVSAIDNPALHTSSPISTSKVRMTSSMAARKLLSRRVAELHALRPSSCLTAPGNNIAIAD